MHERSLARALLTQVERIRRRNDAGRVAEVRVAVGPLAGVEPLLLASAFEELTAGDIAADAALVVDEVPLTAECPACEYSFEVEDFQFRCPKCGGNVKITGGDSLQLVSVSLADCEPVQETTW